MMDRVQSQEYMEKLAIKKKQRNVDDIKFIAKHPAGRRFLWRILFMSEFYNVGFLDNEKLMYYHAGKREVGKLILDDMQQADPALFAQLQAEYYSEVRSERNTSERLLEEDIKNGAVNDPNEF